MKKGEDEEIKKRWIRGCTCQREWEFWRFVEREKKIRFIYLFCIFIILKN